MKWIPTMKLSPCLHKAGLNVPRSKPGTQCHTARRLYVSSLANFRVSDPKYGVAHKDVRYRQCAKDGAFGGNPAPTLGAYTVSLLLRRKYRACVTQVPLCVVSTERCVTQVPYKGLSRLMNAKKINPIVPPSRA